jgi:hypothetical protein
MRKQEGREKFLALVLDLFSQVIEESGLLDGFLLSFDPINLLRSSLSLPIYAEQ